MRSQERSYSIQPWLVNNSIRPVYIAYRTATKDINDTYGYLERDLINGLLVDGKRHELRMSHPGAYSVGLFSKNPHPEDNSLFVVSLSPDEIESMAGFQNDEKNIWIKRIYKPLPLRRPVATATNTDVEGEA